MTKALLTECGVSKGTEQQCPPYHMCMQFILALPIHLSFAQQLFVPFSLSLKGTGCSPL